jgi:hypothetical protein
MTHALVSAALVGALFPFAQEDVAPGTPRISGLAQLPEGFVRFARVPEEGLFPRVALDQGELAVLYYKGGEDAGDLFLARSAGEAESFAPSVRVNAAPGSVACDRDVHGGALDLGPDGSAHVVWTEGTEPRSILYTRIPRDGDPLAPIVLGAPPGLCLSVAVAVDDRGRIFVFHAAAEDEQDLEKEPPVRRVWMRSSEDGLSFSEPWAIDRENTSVSEHSAISAHVDELMGTLFVLYRTCYSLIPENPNHSRGMRLLSSVDGMQFKGTWVDNWKGPRDPRSGSLLSQEDNSTLAVWDAGGQVFCSVIRRQVKKLNMPMEPRSEGPAVVRTRPAGAAQRGEICMAWLERPKGAPDAPLRVGWRVWLREGRAPIGGGFAPQAPRAGAPFVFPRGERGFTVLY